MIQDGQIAYQKILAYENKLKEAEGRLDRVKNEYDAYTLLSGAYRLKALLNEMEKEKHCWTSQQFNDVQTPYAKARVFVALSPTSKHPTSPGPTGSSKLRSRRSQRLYGKVG